MYKKKAPATFVKRLPVLLGCEISHSYVEFINGNNARTYNRFTCYRYKGMYMCRRIIVEVLLT